METCRLSANPVVDRATKKMAPTAAHMDCRGRDRDDYRQLFLLRAWLAHQTAPDHGEDSRERWEFTAVRNQLRSYKKELNRHPELVRWDLLAEHDQHGPSFERLMEIRQVIRKIEEYLSPFETELLATWAAHGCSSASAWAAYGRSGSYPYFCRRLRGVRHKCQRMIQKICPEIVPNRGRLAL